MTNEAFARVRIDALLGAQGWNTQDTNAVRFEVVLPEPPPLGETKHVGSCAPATRALLTRRQTQ